MFQSTLNNNDNNLVVFREVQGTLIDAKIMINSLSRLMWATHELSRKKIAIYTSATPNANNNDSIRENIYFYLFFAECVPTQRRRLRL